MKNNFQKDIQILQEFAKKNKNLKVALLCGPKSYEDAFYFDQLPFDKISSGYIFKELKKIGFIVRVVKNTDDNLEQKLRWADVVFVNMHGEFGEDGAIQGLLEYIKKPYTGSGIFSNSLTINKIRFKEFLHYLNFLTPNYLDSARIDDIDKIKFPAILKLINGGSSIGMIPVASMDDYQSSIKNIVLSQFRVEDYFVEEFISGRDLTISIIDLPTKTVVLPILEIQNNGFLYDEKAKINSQKGDHSVKYIVPALLNKTFSDQIAKIALDVYKKARCCGFARIDVVIRNKKIYILELNSITGLQQESNFLLCANAAGLSFKTTLLALIYNALGRQPK